MCNRPFYMPIGSFLASALAFAPQLYSQDISSLDSIRPRERQARSSAQVPQQLAQTTKAKPVPARPAAPPPSFNPSRRSNPVPIRPYRTAPKSDKYLPTRQAPPSANPSHQVGAQGILSFFGSGGGFEYHYQPLAWLSGGISYSHTEASFSQTKFGDTEEYLDGQMERLKFQARYIGLNPVYFGLGIAYASLSGSHGWRGSGVVGGKLNSDFTSSIFITDVFLGSEWNIADRFYIGADWFGFAYPLAGSVEVDSTDEADAASEFLTGATIENRVSREISAQLKLYYLVLRAGYRF